MSTQTSGNTTFYQKAAAATLSFRDIFKNVFKKRQKGDGARQFMAGTVLSTPAPDEMLRSWQRPWIFARVLVVGIPFLIAMFLLLIFAPIKGSIPAMALVMFGAAIIPLATLLFFWEMNIPRNLPIYDVIIIFFIGGVLSLMFTAILIPFLAGEEAWTAPFFEEPAKLLAMLPFLIRNKGRKNYILTGILLGAAVGAGFEVFESAGYVFEWLMEEGIGGMLHVLLIRCLPNAHTMWAALYGGALAWAMNGEKLKVKHFVHPRFLLYFGAAMLIHALNNGLIEPIFILGITLPLLLFTAACWLLMLPLLRKGIQQVLLVVNTAAIAQPPQPKTVGYILYGVTGMYAGQAVELPVGKVALGRDPGSCNLLFPADTKGISRRHCTLSFDGSAVTLTDDGSSQGTFLDGSRRLEQGKEMHLHAGQRFSLAGSGVVFELRKQ